MNSVIVTVKDGEGKTVLHSQIVPTGQAQQFIFGGGGLVNVEAIVVAISPGDAALAEILSLVKAYAEDPTAELRHERGTCDACDAGLDHLIEAWKRYTA